MRAYTGLQSAGVLAPLFGARLMRVFARRIRSFFLFLTTVIVAQNSWLSSVASKGIARAQKDRGAKRFSAELDQLKGLPIPIPHPQHPNHFLSYAEHTEQRLNVDADSHQPSFANGPSWCTVCRYVFLNEESIVVFIWSLCLLLQGHTGAGGRVGPPTCVGEREGGRGGGFQPLLFSTENSQIVAYSLPIAIST